MKKWTFGLIVLLILALTAVEIACSSEKPVVPTPTPEPTPIPTTEPTKEQETILQVTDRELLDRAMVTYAPNMGKSGYFYYGGEGDLDGISVGQLIRVRGKIDTMNYEEKPSGAYFHVYFKPKGSRTFDGISFQFANIPTMRAKELILKGLINEGDEVTIQGTYGGYEAINSGEGLDINMGDECSFVDMKK